MELAGDYNDGERIKPALLPPSPRLTPSHKASWHRSVDRPLGMTCWGQFVFTISGLRFRIVYAARDREKQMI